MGYRLADHREIHSLVKLSAHTQHTFTCTSPDVLYIHSHTHTKVLYNRAKRLQIGFVVVQISSHRAAHTHTGVMCASPGIDVYGEPLHQGQFRFI